MSLAAGDKLGPYEILAPLGAGGMGEVYRARDTRLKREVAVKILPADVAGDPVRRQRFELEARAVAALNHPNIVSIYDVGEENGVFFSVSELVDGEPLRGMKFGLRKTLDCAIQIATGLAAAHAAGIVHRDLKPGNVLLTRDGRIKILDFGLAKVMPARSGSGATETLTVNTDPGMALGTAGYMSPEQVKGQVVDHRSDIFSFGVMMYELLGGRRAFQGETAVETMTAILKQDPPDLPDTVPAGVRQVVSHCLEKDPGNRFQSARDLSFALEAMSHAGSASGVAPVLAQGSSARRRALAGAAVLALLALGAAGTVLLRRTPDVPVWSAGLLGGPEMALNPRLSPDGHLIALQAMDHGTTQVAVMKPESGNWSVLTHNRELGSMGEVSWSPDGTMIYYDRITDVPQGIFSVPVLGGEEKLVLENAESPEALPDGTLLVYKLNASRNLQLFHYWPETGRLQELPLITHQDIAADNTHIRVTPDGKTAVVSGVRVGQEKEEDRLLAVDLATGASRPLTVAHLRFDNYATAVTRDGNAVITAISEGDLQRVVSIPLRAAGEPRTLFTTTTAPWYMDVGADGSIYASLNDQIVELVRLSSDGKHSDQFASYSSSGQNMVASLPDGRMVAPMTALARSRLMALAAGKDPAPFVAANEETAAPLTAAGPRQIAFMIGSAPHQTIALAETATGRLVNRIEPGKGGISSLAASPDGRTLYFAAARMIWSVPAAGGEARRIRAGDSVAADPSGQFLVVSSIESSKMKLFRVALDSGTGREITTDGSVPLAPIFLSPGAVSARGLLVVLQPKDSWFWAPGLIDLTTGRITRLPADPALNYQSLDWLPDGRIAMVAQRFHSVLWRFQPKLR